MSLTVPEALFNSELRSLGRFVYEVVGGAEPILFERRQDISRPYWKIDGGAGTIGHVASGWQDGNRTFVVGYYGAGRQNCSEKIERVRSAARGAVPFYVFDGTWLNPRIVLLPEDPLGDNLEPGTYSVSCSFISMHDEETLPSKSFSVTLVAPGRLMLFAPTWPWRSPLSGSARFYVGASGARRMAGEVPFPAHGWPSLLVDSLPAGDAPLEVSKSRVYLGPLWINQISGSIFESPDTDGDFDAVLTLTCSRELPLDLPDVVGWTTYQAADVIIAPAEESAFQF